MDKEKTEYPELRLNNKKATTIEEKAELFKQFWNQSSHQNLNTKYQTRKEC